MGCPKITLVQNLTPTNTVVGVALVVPILVGSLSSSQELCMRERRRRRRRAESGERFARCHYIKKIKSNLT